VRLALCLGLIPFILPAHAAQLALPAVPHYELSPPALSQPASPPRYTEQYNKRDTPGNAEDDKGEDRKSLWERITGDAVAFVTLCLTGVTGVLALSTVGLWIVTGIAGKRQSRDMRDSIKVAEDAVAANLEALAHARETAERDFRPWLTLDARLISPVDVDPIRHNYEDDEEGVAFFIELRCRNVGKVAALNVIYSVSGIDIAHNEDSVWLKELIDASVHACKFSGPQSWMADHSLEWSYDSLAPSEEYKAKRWCQIGPLKPDSVWRSVPKERRIYRFCVGIVAAYSSVGTSGHIFYTAKVLPVGKVNLPEFLGLIRHTEIPIGTDEVRLGPTYKAIAT
jgi:hypothetical protein